MKIERTELDDGDAWIVSESEEERRARRAAHADLKVRWAGTSEIARIPYRLQDRDAEALDVLAEGVAVRALQPVEQIRRGFEEAQGHLAALESRQIQADAQIMESLQGERALARVLQEHEERLDQANESLSRLLHDAEVSTPSRSGFADQRDLEFLGPRDKLNALHAEYRTLRQEILTGIKLQYSIAGFGIIGVALLGLAAGRVNELFAIAIMLVGVPVLCLLVVSAWMNEQVRILRVELHVLELEDKINSVAREVVLNWTRIANAEDQPEVQRLSYRLLSSFFGLVALCSMSLGLYRLWMPGGAVLAAQVLSTLFVTALTVYAARILRRVKANQWALRRHAW